MAEIYDSETGNFYDPDNMPTCCVCKKNRVVRMAIALCKECLDKQNYSDISIGLNSSIMNNE